MVMIMMMAMKMKMKMKMRHGGTVYRLNFFPSPVRRGAEKGSTSCDRMNIHGLGIGFENVVSSSTPPKTAKYRTV